MAKTICITGATDGIGLALAGSLAAEGHKLLLHGRNPEKLAAALAGIDGQHDSYLADMSDLAQVEAMAETIAANHGSVDVLINNAGIFRTENTRTADGFDVRFVVNTFAPVLLTRKLVPLIPASGRVVNLSSAAQAPVDLAALRGEQAVDDAFNAYAQSKLALTMWSRVEGLARKASGPMMVAVNPGSMLASKMVTEGFGAAGNEIGIGVDILTRAALADEFTDAAGTYFDNDAGHFAAPHPDALDQGKCDAVITAIDEILPR